MASAQYLSLLYASQIATIIAKTFAPYLLLLADDDKVGLNNHFKNNMLVYFFILHLILIKNGTHLVTTLVVLINLRRTQRR